MFIKMVYGRRKAAHKKKHNDTYLRNAHIIQLENVNEVEIDKKENEHGKSPSFHFATVVNVYRRFLLIALAPSESNENK